MSESVSVVYKFRYAICLLLAAVAATAWIATVEPGDGTNTLIAGLYRERWFAVNVILTWIAVLSIIAAVGRPTRGRVLNLALMNAVLVFMVGVFELPAVLGIIDYGALGSNHRPSPEFGLSRRSLPHQTFDGSAEQDLVTLLGAEGERLPYRIHLDKYGLRNETDIDDPRVVCLGDSVLYAGFVSSEEMMTRRLSKLLGVSVLNVAEPGYSPQEEFARFRSTGIPSAGRVFVQFVFEGNDFGGSAAWRAAGGTGISEGKRSRMLSQKILSLLHAPRRGIAEKRRGLFHSADGDVPVYFLYDARSVDANREETGPLAQYLSGLREDLNAVGSRLVVVYVPSSLTVLGPYCSWPSLSEVGSEASWNCEARRLFVEGCRAKGVDLIDTTDALRAEASRGVLPYLKADTHLNGIGHAILAREIAERIRPILAEGAGHTK